MPGLITLPWWGYVLVALTFTHLTIVAVTVYLHRHQAHRALDLHPLPAHFFRFWLWLTTGMSTREWTAVHRKHHAFVETERDPHSPRVHGIRKVLWQGAELYREAAADPATLEKFGHGTPDDWLERRLYGRHHWLGVVLMLAIDLLLFGAIGLTIWAVQMAWIPFFAAGVINGAAHWRGYRNFETPDTSFNLTPWGVVIGGEELHNNHHAFASSARFSMKPWELDVGWIYIRVLQALKLARVKKLAPRPTVDTAKGRVDHDTLAAVIAARLHVMADYAHRVVRRVHRDELAGACREQRRRLAPTRRLLSRAEARLGEHERRVLVDALAHSRALSTVYQFQKRLMAIFSERAASQERLLQQLQDWCRQAEETGIEALGEFAQRLRGYTLRPV